jgi:predicted glycogen debranching enzyme
LQDSGIRPAAVIESLILALEKPVLTIDTRDCNDLGTLKSREWLITNEIGGYASSTVSGINTRRYHGLLVAATQPPVGRIVMLSKLEEVLIVDGVRIDLATNLYRDDVVHPEGYRKLHQFRLDPFPTYTYSDDRFILEKCIYMPHGENTVVVEYLLIKHADVQNIRLEISPLIAFRDFHAMTHENSVLDGSIVQTPGCAKVKPYSELSALYLSHNAEEVVQTGCWYRNFEFEEERLRGLDHHEDLFNPLTLRASMNERSGVVLIASTEPRPIELAAEYRRAEIRLNDLRYHNNRSRNGSSDLIPKLEAAAEQFLVAREPFETVIAGYHWFSDWGRDTMIALPGLLLSTDRPEAAKEILLEFLRYLDGGMLPNRFPDRGETPEYNTVDATLWFIETIWQYLNYCADSKWRQEALQLIREQFYPALKSILDAHLSGTRYHIQVDSEGFLWAGDSNTQLTWMDAKVGDVAITPRAGRPVEIQALWYNALRIVEELGREFGDSVSSDYFAGRANRLLENFERVFWNSDEQCLYDVVGASGPDPAIRPNQVIAVSLRHCLVSEEKARLVLKSAERHLLTPFGLRTLSPADPNYRSRCEGDVWNRDSAYHQGTVWPWLAGPFFSAKIRFADDISQTLAEAQSWLDRLSSHLEDACLGQVSEIFDAEEPHTPRGCVAQAWSVAELLRLAKLVRKRSRMIGASIRSEAFDQTLVSV